MKKGQNFYGRSERPDEWKTNLINCCQIKRSNGSNDTIQARKNTNTASSYILVFKIETRD